MAGPHVLTKVRLERSRVAPHLPGPHFKEVNNGAVLLLQIGN